MEEVVAAYMFLHRWYWWGAHDDGSVPLHFRTSKLAGGTKKASISTIKAGRGGHVTFFLSDLGVHAV